MTYATEIASTSREVQYYIKVILDQCTRENKYMYAAEATCAATAQCDYTYPTCQDTTNYDKGTEELLFCNREARIAGAKPLLRKESVLSIFSTEIDSAKFRTSRGIATFKLAADTAAVYRHPDKLYDAARQSDAQDTGNFWPNLIARNPNYKNRLVEVYQGFKGLAAASFELKWRGLIQDIRLSQDIGGGVEIDAVDILYGLVEQDTPKKIPDAITVNDNPLTAGATTINLALDGDTTFDPTDYFEIPDYDSGSSTTNQYRLVKIGSEYIAYNQYQGGAATAAQLKGCVRGIMSTAAEHAQDSAVTQVSMYGDASAASANWAAVGLVPGPHIFMDLICNIGGVSASYIETYTGGSWTVNGAQLATATTININNCSSLPTVGIVKIGTEMIRYTGNSGTAITGCKRGCYGTDPAALGDTDDVYPVTVSHWMDNHLQGFTYKGWFESSKKAYERLRKLRENTLVDVWQNEDGKIDFRLQAPPYSGASLTTYTSGTDMAHGSRKVRRNEADRVTDVIVHYGALAADPGNDSSDHPNKYAYIDRDRSSANHYGQVIKKDIYAPFIHNENEAALLAARYYMKYNEAAPTVEFDLELKDEALEVGHLCKLTLPEVVDTDGAQDTRIYQVIKKAYKSAGVFLAKCRDLGFGSKRYCLISNDSDDYDDSSADKTTYGWIGSNDANNTVGAAKDPGYYIY